MPNFWTSVYTFSSILCFQRPPKIRLFLCTAFLCTKASNLLFLVLLQTVTWGIQEGRENGRSTNVTQSDLKKAFFYRKDLLFQREREASEERNSLNWHFLYLYILSAICHTMKFWEKSLRWDLKTKIFFFPIK